MKTSATFPISTIIAKLLPIKGEITTSSTVMLEDIVMTYGKVESLDEGQAFIRLIKNGEVDMKSEPIKYTLENLSLVGLCAVETDFKAPIKAIALNNHAFAKFGQQYRLKKERERGNNNVVVIVKGFEKVGDFYDKAKADDKSKPLWIKKEIFGLNLGPVSEKAKWVVDGMSIDIKTKKSLLLAIEPVLNVAGKITVKCDRCGSYH